MNIHASAFARQEALSHPHVLSAAETFDGDGSYKNVVCATFFPPSDLLRQEMLPEPWEALCEKATDPQPLKHFP